MKKKVKDYMIVSLIILASIIVFIFRKNVSKVGEPGYIGVFLLCFLSSLTVFLPSPGLLVVMSPYGPYFKYVFRILSTTLS